MRGRGCRRLRLSCPGFHVCVVGVNLSHEAALYPATDILAGFSEHGRLRFAIAFHPIHTGKRGACELGLQLNEWTHVTVFGVGLSREHLRHSEI